MEDLDFVVSSVPQNEEVLVFVFLRKERSQLRMNDAAKVRLLSAQKTNNETHGLEVWGPIKMRYSTHQCCWEWWREGRSVRC